MAGGAGRSSSTPCVARHAGRGPASPVAPEGRRQRTVGAVTAHEAIDEAIRALLEQRAPDATICPSEAARAIGGEDWRAWMDPARAAARRLVARGEVVITQRGRIVDPATAKGPIRIRRAAGG